MVSQKYVIDVVLDLVPNNKNVINRMLTFYYNNKN